MLYYPGAFTQAIGTAIFIIIASVIGYLGVRIYIQDLEIRSLKISIVEQKKELEVCNDEQAKLSSDNSFLRDTLKLRDAYYNRKPKPPVVVNGEFKKENLFWKEPR
jgi:hypothetical protein